MRAVSLSRAGGPEVLELAETPIPRPGPGQVLLKTEAIGLNFVETYQRSGLYPLTFPTGLGSEAAGVVEAVGEGVTRLKPGDQVVTHNAQNAYAEYCLANAGRVIKRPEAVDARLAAATLLKGMTTEFLIRRLHRVEAGETVLVHAAAGGVGQIMLQWCKLLGATVIATVGSAAKAERAKALGADHVILYREQDLAAEVRRLTDGEGVPVAFDSIGKDTFEGTLGSLARRGLFVSFGSASGPPPPVEPRRLMQGGSLLFTRPTMGDYLVSTEDLEASAASVFDLVGQGKVKVDIGQTFPLADVQAAHRAMQRRDTIGASLLLP